MFPVDPTPGHPQRSAPALEVDDLGRFDVAAQAFCRALDAACAARGPFVAGAANLRDALGDPGLAARYDETFVGMLRTLDALEHGLEEFNQALRATGRGYRQADASVFRGLP